MDSVLLSAEGMNIMKALLNWTILLSSVVVGLSADADRLMIEKYDRMYKRLMEMTDARGPMASLSRSQREAFMLDVRKMMTEVSGEIQEEFVSVGGGSVEKKEAREQLVLLTARQKESRSVRKVLDRFSVENAHAEFSHHQGSVASTVLNLTCHNSGQFAVSKVRVRATVVSEGRSVPWAQDDYLIRIRGGVEPGERREIKEAVRGDLAFEAPAATELQLVVKVIELFDENGESVGKDTFSEKERRSLADFEAIREDLYH